MCYKESNKKAWNNTKKRHCVIVGKKGQVREYLGKTTDINKENIIYIDETGINSYLQHEHAYPERGKKVYSKIIDAAYKQ